MSNCFAPQVISDQTFEELPEEVRCPPELEYIWDWYYELDASRSSGFDLNPILYTEIEAWSRLNSLTLSSFEIKAIKAIDVAYMRYNRTSNKREQDG